MSAWIKMRTDLRDDKRIMAMADMMNLPDATIVGAFFIVWSYADTHTTDGRLGIPPSRVNKLVGIPGFAEAAAAVDWLTIGPDGLCSIPRFNTHNGRSAKRRASDANRKSSKRSAKRPPDVPPPSAPRPHQKRTPSGHSAELDKSKRRERVREEERESDKRAQDPENTKAQAARTDSNPAGDALAFRQTADPPEFDIVRILRAWWPQSDKAYTLAAHPNATAARVCWLADRVRRERCPKPPGFVEKGILEGWPVPPEWQARFDRATGLGRAPQSPPLRLSGAGA